MVSSKSKVTGRLPIMFVIYLPMVIKHRNYYAIK